MSGLRILVLGASGRLGACLVRRYHQRHGIVIPPRSEVDLGHPSRCVEVIRSLGFDVLINCAGITSPDLCEEDPQRACIINAESPAAIAALCYQRGARMIHVSTDYVFAGTGSKALTEEAAAEPISVYGATKLAGERGVLSACPTALIARVSWLFGPDKASFPDSILRQARAGQKLSAIQDKWSTPSSIDDIALWIEDLFTRNRSVAGTLHLCNSGACSWQEYAQSTVDIAHRIGLLKQPALVHGQPLDGFPLFKALRPRYTPLSNALLTSQTGILPDTWQVALERYLLEIARA